MIEIINKSSHKKFRIGVVQDKYAFPNALEFLEMARELGADHAELKYELKAELEQQLSGETAKEIRSFAEVNSISLSVHAPYDDGVNFGDMSQIGQEITRQHMLACLDFCQLIGAQYITIHGGFYTIEPQPLVQKTLGKGSERIAIRSLVPKHDFLKLKDHVLQSFAWFKEEAEKRGLVMAIENLHDFSDFKVRFPITPQDLLECKDYLGPDIRINYDSGHAHSTDNHIVDFIQTIGPEFIIGTHLHDNDKSSDLHLPIFQGTVDFASFFQHYLNENWFFPLNIEAKNYNDLVDSVSTLNEIKQNSEVLQGGGNWAL